MVKYSIGALPVFTENQYGLELSVAVKSFEFAHRLIIPEKAFVLNLPLAVLFNPVSLFQPLAVCKIQGVGNLRKRWCACDQKHK